MVGYTQPISRAIVRLAKSRETATFLAIPAAIVVDAGMADKEIYATFTMG